MNQKSAPDWDVIRATSRKMTGIWINYQNADFVRGEEQLVFVSFPQLNHLWRKNLTFKFPKIHFNLNNSILKRLIKNW